MALYQVEVQADHIKRLGLVRPVAAIMELVWNGLDADATEVHVHVESDLLGGVRSIEVVDNGTGMSHPSAREGFVKLGGSWKQKAGKTKGERRLLHGRLGRGRFRAFALGDRVVWTTIAQERGKKFLFEITGTTETRVQFDIAEPTETDEPTGTRVLITEIPTAISLDSVSGQKATQAIVEEFAIYLHKYSTVKIFFDGVQLDPSSLEENQTAYDLTPVIGKGDVELPVRLEIVEWKMKTDRHLYLCDGNGFTLHRVPPMIHAPGFHFTAYLATDLFRQQEDAGLLEIEEPTDKVAPVIEEARQQLRAHFKGRHSLTARELLATWKERMIYPFEGEAQNPIEEAQRQVFDLVAITASEYVSEFAATNPANTKAQKLSFALLREALEESPDNVRKILTTVLDLPAEKRNELADLLETTTLSSIISAAKLVTDRLTFLKALEIIIFDHKVRKLVKERKHLHKILEKNTWIFGEEFNLTNSDKTLEAVLDQHLVLLGREPRAKQDRIRREDGRTGIIDLQISRTVPQPRADQHEHLVIELKKPDQEINSIVLGQIRSYAFAVADDSRFQGTATRWEFWALGASLSKDVKLEASQSDRPPGCVFQSGGIRIWVKQWGEVLNQARARMNVFQTSLNFEASDESGLEHLRRHYATMIPPEIAVVPAEAVELTAPAA
jgi:hypothetical protein